ncbi:Crp/Fnr family transcriptional regulator [Xanthobacter sp. V4C-4]|uniref:Crp/Fnr family transcriptional regulator n=1 Tax=Xanthobacter cornucopiae TaxID=3119924 RepID=UPI003727C729
MTTSRTVPWYWERFDLFAGLPPEARALVEQLCERRVYRRGESVFAADDPASHVFWLDSGLVKIFHLSTQGEVTIFWFCMPGDWFGAGGISGAPEQAVFGQAVERSVVHVLRRADFERALLAFPQLALKMIRQVSGRLRLACDALVEKTARQADVRLAGILLRLARNCGEPRGDEIPFRVRITQQDLADMVGACRQTVNRTLNDFAQHGLLRFEGRRLVLTDPAGLQRLQEAGQQGNQMAGQMAGQETQQKAGQKTGGPPATPRRRAAKPLAR